MIKIETHKDAVEVAKKAAEAVKDATEVARTILRRVPMVAARECAIAAIYMASPDKFGSDECARNLLAKAIFLAIIEGGEPQRAALELVEEWRGWE